MSVDKQEIKALADRVKTDRRFCADENHHVLADGVLALIAEIERLGTWSTAFLAEREAQIRQRDQLKAENEALRKRVSDLSPFRGAPLAGPDTRCLACGEHHYGLGGLPCPKMTSFALKASGKGTSHG
ncbi:hypothetical protein JRG49_06425 [Pseudomonas fulva]|uniref:hypothetical protein n=1 Tax=Pseudomonas TaxID=286 RepID=UPI000EDF02D5|nr:MULTISPECIES: hypothetical protein [Pseudomonas]MCY4125911.1 hypothetical protein [Pseudomonas sp.]MBN6789875.1 hypothetical protein [Pseudomonas fulva]MBN6794845.1 hypothetical protein [Pseudomonas fulva]MBN6855336.1 hypothetical protein [Pseudomonas fulva]MBN6872467.1 hypothetical protein [Pseudomonas fulva]